MSATVEQVIEAIQSFRYIYDRETDLQAAIAKVFDERKIPFVREFRLGDDLKIDFMVPEGIGIEIKIKGSPSDVARQLLGYANRPEVKCLILVTGKSSLGRLPEELLGKKLYIVALWRNFL